MTEKQALVVMLPLTDEQWRAANAAPYAHDKGPMPGIEASIRAIGTPVEELADRNIPAVGRESDGTIVCGASWPNVTHAIPLFVPEDRK